MFFVKLYEKDELTGKYTYGHTKSYFNTSEILVIHNLILMQMLNQMHKVNLNLAPKNTISLFEKPEAIPNANVNSNILNNDNVYPPLVLSISSLIKVSFALIISKGAIILFALS